MDAANELSETKMGLLLAAERLFATQGIAATTIRQINTEAGQKNSSAIHYHFGSRDAILDAIVALRVTPANQERAKLLEDARREAGDKPLTTDRIVHLLMDPGINRLMHTQGPHFSQRFILQLRMNFDTWRRYEREHLAWTLDDLQFELRRARPYVPVQVLRSRFRSAINFSMFSMAEIEVAENRLGDRFSRDEAEFRIEELISSLIAIIDAPITPGTAASLEKVMSSGKGAPPGFLTE
ncbi:TetR family transcriptional regulator [Pseudooceanicola sp. 216_PA32_1]|uniref:TetR family transcriptional regulator n=1 Tax=Pseudooceanicola pacificus TaxID=2676438 RepID=A0A844W0K9_9RHOB|nr:TetR/AcrR family transcriptional regulator [Pseudooceanicola pacificus]MWB76645.1 TetR family transcriptional regulator [Pseudooceanicola pacificus]